MPIGDVDKLVSMLNEALTSSNERAIVYLSYNKNGQYENKERIFFTDSVPHNWLFPRVAATVIHGGAGTCSASLKAGKPTIVIPFMGDQTFWGEQVNKIGAGPRPVLYKNLNAEKLAGLINEAVTNKTMIENAMRIGEVLQAENGSLTAASIIHNFLGL
jgi:sterol 3beta-glucosyltransferase